MVFLCDFTVCGHFTGRVVMKSGPKRRVRSDCGGSLISEREVDGILVLQWLLAHSLPPLTISVAELIFKTLKSVLRDD